MLSHFEMIKYETSFCKVLTFFIFY